MYVYLYQPSSPDLLLRPNIPSSLKILARSTSRRPLSGSPNRAARRSQTRRISCRSWSVVRANARRIQYHVRAVACGALSSCRNRSTKTRRFFDSRTRNRTSNRCVRGDSSKFAMYSMITPCCVAVFVIPMHHSDYLFTSVSTVEVEFRR